MADLNQLDPTLDPVVRAAMITQPTDTEEEKSAKSLDEKAEEVPADEKKEEQHEEPEKSEKSEESVESEKEETEKSEETKEAEETEEKPEKVEQKESEAELEPKRKTRRERRAERKAFLDSVRREQEQKANKREQRYAPDPDYKPLEFESKEYDHKELEEDRSKYGQNEFAKGAMTAAETEKWYADQDKFWQATEYESKFLEKEPEFAFMDEANPETYDEERTADLNEAFLAVVGFDPEKKTVMRTDISFEKFARWEMDRIKRWAEELNEASEQNMAAQKSQSAVRPSGTPQKGMGILKPGDISKMSDEEYEKNRDEINRQILDAL